MWESWLMIELVHRSALVHIPRLVARLFFLSVVLLNNMLPASSKETIRTVALAWFILLRDVFFANLKHIGEKLRTQGHDRALDLSFALVLQQRAHLFHIPRSCDLQGSGALHFPGGVPTSLRNSGQQWDYPNAWAPLQHMLIEGRHQQTVHCHLKKIHLL